MVSLDITVEGEKRKLYMDNRLHKELTEVIVPGIHKKDKDWPCIIDGPEGSGKSVLALQIGRVLDPTFNLKNVCMTPMEFTKAIINANPGQCVIFDEAFTGLSSRGALSEINRVLVSLMMEMRQKNLYVLIVMPTFFELDRYVALHRSKGLFHVYQNSGRRGFWTYFNEKNKKILYLKGRKMYDYSYPRTGYFGRFLDQYPVNEEEYRQKKREALENKTRYTKSMKLKSQRDALFYLAYREWGISQRGIAQAMKNIGDGIDASSISDAIVEKQKDIDLRKELVNARDELVGDESETPP